MVGPDHELHGQTESALGLRSIDLHGLQMVEQAGAAEPRRPIAPGRDVVSEQRAHRDRLEAGVAGEPREFAADGVEHAAVEVHEIHLVDRQHEVPDAQEARDARVAPRLRTDAVARVDEQDGDIGGGGAGRHVARVLLVARRVGEDELAPRRGEVAVRDVDRDALLALGSQPVGEEREIDRPRGPVARRGLDRAHLILVHRPRVVQEPPDERALPVVDAAGRADPEKTRHVQKYPSRFLSSIEPSWSWSITRS